MDCWYVRTLEYYFALEWLTILNKQILTFLAMNKQNFELTLAIAWKFPSLFLLINGVASNPFDQTHLTYSSISSALFDIKHGNFQLWWQQIPVLHDPGGYRDHPMDSRTSRLHHHR